MLAVSTVNIFYWGHWNKIFSFTLKALDLPVDDTWRVTKDYSFVTTVVGMPLHFATLSYCGSLHAILDRPYRRWKVTQKMIGYSSMCVCLSDNRPSCQRRFLNTNEWWEWKEEGRKVQKIVKDSSHPSHRLFSLLPQVKQYRSAKARSKRLLNSFYLQAIRVLNN